MEDAERSGSDSIIRWFNGSIAGEGNMAAITAQMVNELRARTGQGMMECKKALTETGGDLEKAIEYFRKKGVKASLGERQASEGRVVGVESGDHKAAALVEIRSEERRVGKECRSTVWSDR